MRKHLRTLPLAFGAAIVAGLAATPALYAQDYLAMPHDSVVGRGMMDQGGMMGTMGNMVSGMMGLPDGMGDMDDMGGMMEHCNAMMQGTDDQRPNDQWRAPPPEQPGQRLRIDRGR
jgi:hypothetical protein